MSVLESTAENERGNGRELDQDVDSRTGGVLKRVTYCVTGNCGLMALSLLLHHDGKLGLGVNSLLGLVCSSFDILLGVIPGATSVGEGESDLDSGDDAACEETTN